MILRETKTQIKVRALCRIIKIFFHFIVSDGTILFFSRRNVLALNYITHDIHKNMNLRKRTQPNNDQSYITYVKCFAFPFHFRVCFEFPIYDRFVFARISHVEFKPASNSLKNQVVAKKKLLPHAPAP